MKNKHRDEAKAESLKALNNFLSSDPGIEKILFVDDILAKFRLVAWIKKEKADALIASLNTMMSEKAGAFWTGDIWLGSDGKPAEKMVYKKAWEEGTTVRETNDRLRAAQRRRNRTAWFSPIEEAPWPVYKKNTGPPIITFYSFKGGVGRSTALAAFAIQNAREGHRVVVVDLDLDAPGIGTLLAADENGTTSPWGAIDYLLERPIFETDLSDYYHACRRESVTGKGEILVVPAGTLSPEKDYLSKLARVDMEIPDQKRNRHPLLALLHQLRKELDPRWILLDSRAGLAESAGVLLSGIAHLNVLFGTSSEQSWQGLRLILERIGASRVRENKPQLDCLIVQAMVPEDSKVGEMSKAEFQSRSLEEFTNNYYAEDTESHDEANLWSVRDSEQGDAPHMPVAISYQPKLAHYDRIDDVADTLSDSAEYKRLSVRIKDKFWGE